MTKHFSLSVLAILASFSVSAATLDVHGEIKINGKTIIDDKGNLIQDKSDLIYLDDYFNAKPNRVVTLNNINPNEHPDSTFTFRYDDKGREFKEEESRNSTVVWSMEWTDRQPMSNIIISYNKWINPNNPEDQYESTQTNKNEFTTSTRFPEVQIGITAARADIYTRTLLTSTDANDTIGTIEHVSEYQSLTVLEKNSYKSESNTIDDCIIVLQDASWMQNAQVRTYCKDYGLVQFGDFKL
ncbi:hypothetical protein [Photobacterium piscicola]|uniref:Uncharacterized protein n=1 Tax=Photobacterium piscicola TaxID=1378299 RepID=A0ABU6LET6_9GAMM|nr:hypothetical protein [Photobacterium piscicola]